jgi:hypothetical protein
VFAGHERHCGFPSTIRGGPGDRAPLSPAGLAQDGSGVNRGRWLRKGRAGRGIHEIFREPEGVRKARRDEPL